MIANINKITADIAPFPYISPVLGGEDTWLCGGICCCCFSIFFIIAIVIGIVMITKKKK